MTSLATLQGTLFRRFQFRFVRIKQFVQIVTHIDCVWMFLAEAIFKDLECASQQRLGLVEAVCSVQQLPEVVEALSNVGMVFAEAGFKNGEAAAHERLGLSKAVGAVKQAGEIGEVGGDIGMVLTET